jgi:hypothetical protein
MNIMQVDTVLNKQGQDLYNGLAWVLLATSQRQFILAWKLWNLQRKAKKGAPQTWARALLQRLSA